MLATSAGCQFEVDRGPDWLLVRVQRLEDEASTSAHFAERCGSCWNSTSPTG